MSTALEVHHDFGELSELVRDIDMAHAAESLAQRHFELTAIDEAQRQLLDVKVGIPPDPKWDASRSLFAAMKERWPELDSSKQGNTGTALERLFSLVADEEALESALIEQVARNSLIALHPDKDSSVTGEGAAAMANVASGPADFRFLRSGAEGAEEVVEIDPNISARIKQPQSQANVIKALIAETNNPFAGDNALMQAYVWLDLTKTAPLRLQSIAEEVIEARQQKPLWEHLGAIKVASNATGMLLNEAGGFRIYGPQEKTYFRLLQDLMAKTIPSAVKQIAEKIKSGVHPSISTSDFLNEQQEQLIRQLEELEHLVESGGSLGQLRTAFDRAMRISESATSFLEVFRPEANPEETAMNLGRFVVGGLARVVKNDPVR